MPRDEQNSMTNVERAEKHWHQLLSHSGTSSIENNNENNDLTTLLEGNKDNLLTALASSEFLAEFLTQKYDW